MRYCLTVLPTVTVTFQEGPRGESAGIGIVVDWASGSGLLRVLGFPPPAPRQPHPVLPPSRLLGLQGLLQSAACPFLRSGQEAVV